MIHLRYAVVRIVNFLIGLALIYCSVFPLCANGTTLPKTIQSASEYSYPPFCIVNENNQADGFSIELLRATLEEMGHEVDFWVGPWEEVKQSLAEKKVHVLPLVGRTPEREALFDFTFPYMKMHGTIVTRSDEDQISSLDDLKGKQVAVMAGDNAEEFVRRQNLDFEIITTSTFEEALSELSQGQYDAVIIQRLLYIQLKEQLGLDNVKRVGPPLREFQQSFCFAVPEGESELLSILNEGLSIVMADGTFNQLREKWFAPLDRPLKRYIVVGGDYNYPPYEYLDEEGQPAGYNVELTQALAKQLGLQVDFQLGPWKVIREKLANREIDLVQGMFYSPGRDKIFDFTDHHTLISHVAVVRSGNEIPQTFAELTGKTVIVMNGDIMHDLAQQAGLSKNLLLAKTQQEALKILSEGRGDCALIARLPAMYWIEKEKLSNLEVGIHSFESSEYCYASHNDNHEMIERFSVALTDLKATGQYRKIYNKWLGVYEDQGIKPWVLAKYLAGLTLPVLLLLLFSFAWSKSLKRQVKARTFDLEKEVLQRQQAEQALRTSEAKNRAMIENILDVISIIDRNGTIRFNSPNIERWLGWSPEERSGRTPWENIHPDDLDRIQKQYRAVVENDGTDTRGECRYRCKDGSYKWVEFTAVNRLSDPNINGILLTYHDITARKKMEESLEETRNILQTAMDQSPAGIAIADAPDGRLRYVNNAGLCIHGGDRKDIVEGVGLDKYVETWKLMDLDGRPLMSEEVPLARAILFGETNSREFIIRREDQEDRIVFGNAAPIKDQAGEIKAAIVIFTDITEHKQAETEKANLQNQLHQAQKIDSVGRLAGGVAHDYNNMLSVIMGYAELAQMKVKDSDPLREDLEQILAAAKRSRDITRQLLAFARKQTADPKVLDLNQTVENALKMLRKLLGENIDLVWKPKENLWPVKIDPTQLEQILANLCINARDAITDVGKMTIETMKICINQDYCDDHPEFVPGDFVALAVSDNGCGMDQNILMQIFEPFFTTKKQGEGTGLGLSMVYGVVKQSNGFINVYSEPGRGTTFKIFFPKHTGSIHVESEVDTLDIVPGHGEKILLVEDETAILELTKTILMDLNYQVFHASKPSEALALANSCLEEIDLLITDVVMPEMNGRELADRLQRMNPSLKCLYMSGYTEDSISHHGVLDEGIYFIHKPFSRAEFSSRVRAILKA